MGFRLTTARTPSAGGMMYPKGGYVLHMLRMMLHDPGSKDPDARFSEMMKDYTKTYGGGNASTADFQKVGRPWVGARLGFRRPAAREILPLRYTCCTGELFGMRSVVVFGPGSTLWKGDLSGERSAAREP
ncbi:MAG TPA: hypothetical protein VE685_24370 [Thermoanaerobaculia bacterium]|nr:hypothetical protein [Thermoanaerobaculia bacterium]